jgi:hypothetical protein
MPSPLGCKWHTAANGGSGHTSRQITAMECGMGLFDRFALVQRSHHGFACSITAADEGMHGRACQHNGPARPQVRCAFMTFTLISMLGQRFLCVCLSHPFSIRQILGCSHAGLSTTGWGDRAKGDRLAIGGEPSFFMRQFCVHALSHRRGTFRSHNRPYTPHCSTIRSWPAGFAC